MSASKLGSSPTHLEAMDFMDPRPAKKRSPAACIIPLLLVAISLHCVWELLSMALRCAFWMASILLSPFLHLFVLGLAVFGLCIMVNVDADHSPPSIEVVDCDTFTTESTQAEQHAKSYEVETASARTAPFTKLPATKTESANSSERKKTRNILQNSKIPVKKTTANTVRSSKRETPKWTTSTESKFPIRKTTTNTVRNGNEAHRPAKPTESKVSVRAEKQSQDMSSSSSTTSICSTPPPSSKVPSSPTSSVSSNASASSATSSSHKASELQDASQGSSKSTPSSNPSASPKSAVPPTAPNGSATSSHPPYPHNSAKTGTASGPTPVPDDVSPKATESETSTTGTGTGSTAHESNDGDADSDTEECKDYFVNFYEVLHISRDATTAQIRKAYKMMAIKYHPDKAAPMDKEKADELFKLIGEAARVLKDDYLRAGHDASIDAGPDAKKAEGPNMDPVTGVTYYEQLGLRNGASVDEVWQRYCQLTAEYEEMVRAAIANGHDVDDAERDALFKKSQLESATADLWDPVKKSHYDLELWKNSRMGGEEPNILTAVPGGYEVVNPERDPGEEVRSERMEGPNGETIDAVVYSYFHLDNGATLDEVWDAYQRMMRTFCAVFEEETSTPDQKAWANELITEYNDYMKFIGEPIHKYWYDDSLWRAGRLPSRPVWTAEAEQAAKAKKAELEETKKPIVGGKYYEDDDGVLRLYEES
ncbi:hypothetical protein BU16DRAFT_562585 [Lophium mytilinum]|uniref:J domain-containing protein n=1 Tax=Lophium mytilinum TaxID=390894 RepID=A0A6A6QR37_9PEZI|nr:hypothetical protein BU16DRAFT_562585 [Lophium mytilinum]